MDSSIQPRVSLIVQLRLSEPWGSDEENEERDKISEQIGNALKERSCGYFDGTDVGGGATNLFFCQIPEGRWDEALAVAIGEIKRQGVSHKAVIAKSVFIPIEPEPEVKATVVWPEGFREEKGDADRFGSSGHRRTRR